MLAFFQMVMCFWYSKCLSKVKRFKCLECGVPEVFVTQDPLGLLKKVQYRQSLFKSE